MNKKVILTIIGTLIIGLIIGFFLSGRLTQNRLMHRRAMMHQPGAEKQVLIKRLNLDDKQIEQISPILDSMIPSQIELRKAHRIEMHATRSVMFDKIRPLLNSKQTKQLDRMRSRMSKHHK
ncbi:MAG: hypothetical protein COA58_16420 [Bacteroidetes bacterium]|nr:MAG: hypothetical protein COA58_16420 [Bacteroidota bacterium]